MKFASLSWLWIGPYAARALIVIPSSTRQLPLASRKAQSIRTPTFRLYSQFIDKELDLTALTADIEAALQAAENALDAEARGKALKSNNAPERLLQDIDDALENANQVMKGLYEELEKELQEYDLMLEQAEQNPTSLISTNYMFGDQAKQVMELLQKGFLKPNEYTAYIKQRKEESHILRNEMAQQAKVVMEQKRREADCLKDALRRAAVRQRKSKHILQISSVALDGAMIGCILGFYLWSSLPIVGYNAPLLVPCLYASGLVACASIVASTLEEANVARQFTDLTKFGFVSRALLTILKALWNVFAAIVRTLIEAVAAVPVLLTSALALWAEDASEAIAEGLNRIITPVADKQRELTEKLEERRIK